MTGGGQLRQSDPPDPIGSVPPPWLTELAESASRMDVAPPLRPPPSGGRPSAVLILFGAGPGGPDLLFIQRSQGLRQHPGQPAFPGGAMDDADPGPAAAALREAAEEAGVDPARRRGPGHPARAVHRAQRFPGGPRSGVVAFSGPGLGGGPARGGGRGTDRPRRTGRPGEPGNGPHPYRPDRAGVPGQGTVHLGFYGGPGRSLADARGLGSSLEHRCGARHRGRWRTG